MSLTATFEISISPGDKVLPTTGRFDFAKIWQGDAQGASQGVMLSAGSAADGHAGYVSLEVFEGVIAGRRGTVAFHQFGSMRGGTKELRYEMVPGSGTGELTDILGVLTLDVDEDGVHHVEIRLN